MHPLPHWRRKELEKWFTDRELYQEATATLMSFGLTLATLDSVLEKRLRNIGNKNSVNGDLAFGDGIAVYDGKIKLDYSSQHLLRPSCLEDGALSLSEEEFNNINSKLLGRKSLESLTRPTLENISSNYPWLALSRFQPILLRNYFSETSKNNSSAMMILLPPDSKRPLLYPLKIGSINNGSILSYQYMDEKTVLAGLKVTY